MTPAQLRILKTLPKVIEAVRALQAESNELMGLLGERRGPVTRVELERAAGGLAPLLPPPGHVSAAEQGYKDHHREVDTREAEARAAAEAELARRQAEATPEQKEAEAFLRSQEAPRKSLLNAALGIAP